MKPIVGYVRNCDMVGCSQDCIDGDRHCEFVAVLVLPLHPEESSEPSFEIQLRAGDNHVVAPWTLREIRTNKSDHVPRMMPVYGSLE